MKQDPELESAPAPTDDRDRLAGLLVRGRQLLAAADRMDAPTAYYLLHRHDFGLEEAPSGACILYATACGLSDHELETTWDILVRTGGSGGRQDEDEDAEDVDPDVEAVDPQGVAESFRPLDEGHTGCLPLIDEATGERVLGGLQGLAGTVGEVAGDVHQVGDAAIDERQLEVQRACYRVAGWTRAVEPAQEINQQPQAGEDIVEAEVAETVEDRVEIRPREGDRAADVEQAGTAGPGQCQLPAVEADRNGIGCIPAVGGEFGQGEVLLELDRRDHELAVTRAQAQIAEAKAALAMRVARLEELRSGSRPQEVQRAMAEVQEARAVLENAKTQLSRMETLHQRELIAAQDRDVALEEARTGPIARQRQERLRDRRAAEPPIDPGSENDSGQCDHGREGMHTLRLRDCGLFRGLMPFARRRGDCRARIPTTARCADLPPRCIEKKPARTDGGHAAVSTRLWPRWQRVLRHASPGWSSRVRLKSGTAQPTRAIPSRTRCPRTEYPGSA